MAPKKSILVLPGDGIGPEVTAQAVQALRSAAAKAGLALQMEQALIGAASFEAHGTPLTGETFAKAQAADAILFGAAGDPKYDQAEVKNRPGRALLRLRRELGLFANLRPVKAFSSTLDASPLKAEVVRDVDLLIVRELTGGIYFGEPRGEREEDGQRLALNTMVYSEAEVERIVRLALEMARVRGRRLTSVDKGNALEVGRFWRQVAGRVAAEYPDVEMGHLYVDNAALQIIREPRQFDVMVMGNLFGDILSDAAGNLAGSLGMLPSASIGEGHALYEPCHGSAPDIAGRDLANPIAAILSVGLLCRHTLGQPALDEALHRAVERVLGQARTADMMSGGKQQVGCVEMGERILAAFEEEA